MSSVPTIRRTFPRFWRLMRHFWPEFHEQRTLVAGSFVVLIFGIFMQLLEPWPLKWVIDHVVRNHTESSPTGTLPFQVSPQLMLPFAAMFYVIVVGARAWADYLQTLGFAVAGNRVISRVRTKLYRHLQSLPMSFHHKSRSGDLLVRVVGDIKLLRDAAVTTILPLCGSVLVLVGMIVVMLAVNWKLALLAMTVLPLFGFTTVRVGRRIHEAARSQRQREGAVAAMAAEAISSMQVVQALSLEQHFEEAVAKHEQRSVSDEVKTRRLSARLERTTDLLIAVATAMVLWYGGLLSLHDRLSPGELIVFLTYLKRGFRPMQDFTKYAIRLAKATAAGERVVELLDTAATVTDAPNALPAQRIEGRIRFDAVSFHYEPEKPVFEELTLAIDAGKFIAVVGNSGSGKSTLLNLLLRFYEPTHGCIEIDGADIRRFTIASLRNQISVVLQDTVLFAASVSDNIHFGAANSTEEQLLTAAKIAGADEFIRRLPQGYATILGERGANLSHGQRQRIAIARAALRDAPLLLLDEPTTGLDQKHKRLVNDALRRLIAGRTTLLVTHDLTEAMCADEIYYFESGRIAEHGSHHQLMAINGQYADIYRLQAQSGPPTYAQLSTASN